MNTSGAFALSLFVSYGLWLVIAPRSVVDFYCWLHKNRATFPQPKVVAVRVVGICWVAFVLVLFAISGHL